MAPRKPHFFALLLPPLVFFVLLLLVASRACAAAGNVAATSPSPSPQSSPPPPADAGGGGSSAGGGGGGGGGHGAALDPRQLTALESMGLPFGRDPCASRDNATACDDGAPFRHLVALRLANCSSELELSPTALRALSTLRSLSLVACPIPAPRRLPLSLAASLRSFSCVASLRRLSAVWLSRLQNLTELAVVDVPVSSGGGPAVVLSHMRLLRSATLSYANLSGVVPHHWHSLGLLHLDLSSNLLRGPVPGSISVLTSLQTLNLSSNALAGTLPDSVGDLADLRNASFALNSLSGPIPESLAQLSALEHLDLSSNQFNGSIPKFLSEMKTLRFLSLENNNFHGVLPFNASFLKKLEVFKVGGNSNLCYNRTLLSSKLELGIAPCNKYGMPVSPPPHKSSRSDSSDYSDDDGGDGTGADKASGGGHHGPSKLVLGVAIGLSCFVFLVIFLVCLSKVCG